MSSYENGRGFDEVRFGVLFEEWIESSPTELIAEQRVAIIDRYRAAFPIPEFVNGIRQSIFEVDTRGAPIVARNRVKLAVADYLRENEVLDTFLLDNLVNGTLGRILRKSWTKRYANTMIRHSYGLVIPTMLLVSENNFVMDNAQNIGYSVIYRRRT